MVAANKEKAKFFLIILLLSVLSMLICLILSGCTSGNYSQLTMKDLRTGSKGLSISFLKEAPPDIIFENDPDIFIVLNIENLGASDVKDGVVAIATEKDYLPVDKVRFNTVNTEQPVVFSLDGKSLEDQNGGNAALEIEAHTKDITLSKYQDSVIRATLCYDYQTVLEESVCIEPDQLRTQMNAKACKAADFSPKSQGAPINVKKVSIQSQKTADGKVRNIFRIEIANTDAGRAMVKGIAKQMCSAKFSKEEEELNTGETWDFVKIRARLGIDEMVCKNNNVIKLKDGKSGETVCEVLTEFQSAYVSPLIVQLDYGYTYTVSKNIKIEAIG